MIRKRVWFLEQHQRNFFEIVYNLNLKTKYYLLNEQCISQMHKTYVFLFGFKIKIQRVK